MAAKHPRWVPGSSPSCPSTGEGWGIFQRSPALSSGRARKEGPPTHSRGAKWLPELNLDHETHQKAELLSLIPPTPHPSSCIRDNPSPECPTSNPFPISLTFHSIAERPSSLPNSAFPKVSFPSGSLIQSTQLKLSTLTPSNDLLPLFQNFQWLPIAKLHEKASHRPSRP